MSSPSGDSLKTPKMSTSPATSTPGSSPEGNHSNGLKDSELLHSDESLVDISVDHPSAIKKDSNEEVTLAEKSVDKASAQDIEDVSCETTKEYTSPQIDGALSCVAQRTRSHTVEMRKNNLTQLLAGLSLSLNLSMEDSFEILSSNAVDSMTLPRYNKEGYNMNSLKLWYDSLKVLDTTIDNVSVLEESNKQEDIVKIYDVKTAAIARRNEEIRPSQESDTEVEGLKKEIEEIRNVTFVMEEPQYGSALLEVIKALETLAEMDLSMTPAKQMENILRIILAICIDYNIQVQSIQETMVSMARFIRELLVLGYKIEIIDRDRIGLEVENQKMKSEVEILRTHMASINQFINRLMTDGERPGSEIAAEIIDLEGKVRNLEGQIKNLEKIAATQEVKYKEM